MGDKRAYLDNAVNELKTDKKCNVVRVSKYIETEAYGGVEQDVFLNGVLQLETLYTPIQLLECLNKIEAKYGRERMIHWGPRTLDLDILLYDDIIMQTEKLTIPHIEMCKRDFVLKPLAEIAPYAKHPVSGKTIQKLLSEL